MPGACPGTARRPARAQPNDLGTLRGLGGGAGCGRLERAGITRKTAPVAGHGVGAEDWALRAPIIANLHAERRGPGRPPPHQSRRSSTAAPGRASTTSCPGPSANRPGPTHRAPDPRLRSLRKAACRVTAVALRQPGRTPPARPPVPPSRMGRHMRQREPVLHGAASPPDSTSRRHRSGNARDDARTVRHGMRAAACPVWGMPACQRRALPLTTSWQPRSAAAAPASARPQSLTRTPSQPPVQGTVRVVGRGCGAVSGARDGVSGQALRPARSCISSGWRPTPVFAMTHLS